MKIFKSIYSIIVFPSRNGYVSYITEIPTYEKDSLFVLLEKRPDWWTMLGPDARVLHASPNVFKEYLKE